MPKSLLLLLLLHRASVRFRCCEGALVCKHRYHALMAVGARVGFLHSDSAAALTALHECLPDIETRRSIEEEVER